MIPQPDDQTIPEAIYEAAEKATLAKARELGRLNERVTSQDSQIIRATVDAAIAALRASSVVKEGHQTAICRECGCTTGGGSYCYAHQPYRVEPLKDGSFRVHRHGLKHVWFDEPPTVATEQPVVEEGQPMKENVLRAQPPESASTPDQAATTTEARARILAKGQGWCAFTHQHDNSKAALAAAREALTIVQEKLLARYEKARATLNQFPDEDVFDGYHDAAWISLRDVELLIKKLTGGNPPATQSPSVADTAPKIPLPPVQDGDPT